MIGWANVLHRVVFRLPRVLVKPSCQPATLDTRTQPQGTMYLNFVICPCHAVELQSLSLVVRRRLALYLLVNTLALSTIPLHSTYAYTAHCVNLYSRRCHLTDKPGL